MGMLGGGRTIDSVWHHYEKVGGAHKTALTRSENFATNHAGMRCVNPQLVRPSLLHVCVSVNCHQCTPCIPQQADSSCIALYLLCSRARVNVECTSMWCIAASDYAMPLVDVACGKAQHTHTHTHTLFVRLQGLVGWAGFSRSCCGSVRVWQARDAVQGKDQLQASRRRWVSRAPGVCRLIIYTACEHHHSRTRSIVSYD